MSWESPSALWLALTIPAVVLLWILKPRRPRLRVPSLLLWPGSPAERQSARPWQRLRNHPLLWIQVALAALLALAAARPFLPAEEAGRHLVVLLDASGSMRAADVEPDRFSAARAAVVEMARGLGPDQEMTLIRLDEQPRVLVAGARTAAQVEAALAGEQPSYGPPEMGIAVALAAGLTQGPAEWVLVGDGGTQFPQDARRPAGTAFRLLQVGRAAGNVAVSGLTLRQGSGEVAVQAGLRNSGVNPVSGRLQLLAEGQLMGAQEWRLEAGSESYLIWSHLPAGPSWYEVRLSGVAAEANALEQDDRAWAAVAASEEERVLLVSPGNSFLERVLAVHGGLRPFRAAPSDWPGLAAQGASYPLTLLDRYQPESLPAGNWLMVGPPGGEEFHPQQVWPRTDHPLLRHVDWSEVRVAAARQVPLPPTGWETVIDSDGGPLLAVRSEGGRRQAVLAFDLSQSDLPLRPAFPVLMANLLEWLLPRPDEAPRMVPPGGSVAVDPAPLAQQVWVEGPEGALYDLAPPWPPRPFRPPAPGLYRVVQSWPEGRQQFTLVAGGYHPLEADLAPRSPELPAEGDATLSPARGALALWPWIAAALLLLSLLEWWVDARGPERVTRTESQRLGTGDWRLALFPILYSPFPIPQSPVLFTFTDPLWLLALPLVAAFLMVARLPWWRAARRAGPRAMRREGLRLALRLLWVSLPLLALAGLVLTRPLNRQAILFVLDASASVVAARDQVEAAARAGAAALEPGDLLGVVAAAAGARVEEGPSAAPLFSRLTASLPDNATDLASGLRLAGAMVPEGYSGRAVLVSDGRQTRGDAMAAARELAARGVQVDVLPLGPEGGRDLRLEAVEFPGTAYRGDVATLMARLYADQPGAATVRVYRDDRLLLERRVDLRSGRQEMALPVPVGEPGLHRYRVEVEAADPAADEIAANNLLGAIQRVMGPPRVLVVVSRPENAGWLTAALPAGGAEVSVVNPSNIPADLAGWARYDTVVLADVAAETLPPGSMDLLERYVRDLGRGLVMAGGPDSFGPGGYADTPVERALPVYMDLRGRGRQPKVAMVLVIDKSGSMSGTKVEMAKEAAARAVRLLRPDDQAGVLAFDSVPQWVAPLTPLSERESLERAIGGIYAGGGTEVYPALLAGYGALRGVQADVKHVILLTDGRSGSGGDYGTLIREMREERISVSTVAVGSDADAALLEAMARAGRGRYHFTGDPQDIPQIFARETLMATRTLLVDSRFYPAAASGSPLLRGLAAVPPLEGYVAATPKEEAEVVLVSPEGDPVLATWQYGLGRSAAWTPDVAGRWAGAWAGSPAATTLWGNLLSWLLPPEETGELAVRVEAEGESAFSVVAENRAGWEEVRPTRATLLGPRGDRDEREMVPAGPGRYRARVGSLEAGAYVVQVTQESGDLELRGEAGWVAPYPAEYRESGVNRAFLAQVAAAGGGRVLEDPARAVEPAARPAVAQLPLSPLLLALAALLWPLEIASRRLVLPAVSAWVPRAMGRRGDGEPGRGGSRRLPLPGGEGRGEGRPPAAATAERLLERKRALRERRR